MSLYFSKPMHNISVNSDLKQRCFFPAPPRFDAPSPPVTARRGASVTLTCVARGDPPLTLTWALPHLSPRVHSWRDYRCLVMSCYCPNNVIVYQLFRKIVKLISPRTSHNIYIEIYRTFYEINFFSLTNVSNSSLVWPDSSFSEMRW